MAASTSVANITDGTDNVDIHIRKLETDYDKSLIILPVVRNLSAINTTPVSSTPVPKTFNIDIQQLKQVITITGVLTDETSNTAIDKIDRLEKIMTNAKELTLTWKVSRQSDTITITKKGSIVKVKITELDGRYGDTATYAANSLIDKRFDIIFQFAIGTFRG